MYTLRQLTPSISRWPVIQERPLFLPVKFHLIITLYTKELLSTTPQWWNSFFFTDFINMCMHKVTEHSDKENTKAFSHKSPEEVTVVIKEY